MVIHPQGNNILVSQVMRKTKETTKSGLIVADIKDVVNYYHVIAVGPEVKKVAVDDIVMSGIHVGLRVGVDGEDFRLLRDTDIWAKCTEFEKV